ncbi:MAG TPA: DinB family protein [Chryseosolibacter sp.]|nr:DinB family protein [Chryseosolibacter sp.]
MSAIETREVWQRGPVDGVPPLLQPVAHALLQAAEDAQEYTESFPAELLWKKPANLASVGFHLLHMRGVVDRLFTYARGEALSPDQLAALTMEKEIPSGDVQPGDLVNAFRKQVERAMIQLTNTDEASLTDPRTLGRMRIPATVIGLLFHTAEHCQRHIGQLLVTARVLQAEKP